MKIDKVRIDIKTTMSSIYFLPFLNEEVRFKFLDSLKNSYIRNNNEDKEFCVLYKFSASKAFLKYEEEILDNTLCIGHEDYDEYVLYKFKITDDMYIKMDRLIKGTLLNLSNEDKRTVVRFARRRLLDSTDLIKQRLEGQFVISKLDMDDELFFSHVSSAKVITANDLYLQAKK